MSKHVYSSSKYSTRAQTLREAGFSVLNAGHSNWHLYTCYHGGSVHTIPRHNVYVRALGTVGNTQMVTSCSMGTAWGGARPTVIGLGKDAATYKNLQTTFRHPCRNGSSQNMELKSKSPPVGLSMTQPGSVDTQGKTRGRRCTSWSGNRSRPRLQTLTANTAR